MKARWWIGSIILFFGITSTIGAWLVMEGRWSGWLLLIVPFIYVFVVAFVLSRMLRRGR